MSWFHFNDTFRSFIQKELNDPGTLIEITFGGKKRLVMIGDMSMYGSVMGGASFIDSSSIIHRYRRVWHR